MSNSTDALMTLLNGPARANDPAKLATLRRQQLEETSAGSPIHGLAGNTQPLEQELATDPYTGETAQTSANRAFEDYLGLARYNSPEETARRKEELAGKVQLAAAPHAAEAAGNLAVENIRDSTARDVARINAQGRVEAVEAKPATYNTQERSALDMINTLQGTEGQEGLAPSLLHMYEQDYPGIGQAPEKFGSATDMFGAKVGGAMYRLGHVSTPSDEALQQLTGYLEATLPRMLAAGRLNRQQYEDLKLHVPQVGLSPGANYLRTDYINKHLMPAIKGGIMSTHQTAPVTTHDLITDPNWGR